MGDAISAHSLEILALFLTTVIGFSGALATSEGAGFFFDTVPRDSSPAAVAEAKLQETKREHFRQGAFVTFIVASLASAGVGVGNIVRSHREKQIAHATAAELLKFRDRVATLEDERNTLAEARVEDARWLMSLYLKGLAYRELQFDNQSMSCDRITIYAHDGGNYFTPFGRICTNPELELPGRPKFEKNQGLISKAWQNGESWDKSGSASDDLEAQIKRLTKFGIPREEAARMRMRSRLLYARRVHGNDGSPVAVIVVESTNAGRWAKQELKLVFDREQRSPYLGPFLDRMRTRIPLFTAAAERGF